MRRATPWVWFVVSVEESPAVPKARQFRRDPSQDTAAANERIPGAACNWWNEKSYFQGQAVKCTHEQFVRSLGVGSIVGADMDLAAGKESNLRGESGARIGNNSCGRVIVSVVICTRNRALFLKESLRSYLGFVPSVEWELVVVDNGSQDETQRLVQEFASCGNIRVRITMAPNPGLSRARNVGWRAAQGEIVAFTDDDCYPSADFVEQIWQAFRDPEIAYVGGRVLLHDPGDAPVTIQTSTVYRRIPASIFVEGGMIHGANLAARRTLLEAIGGFDELLGAGTRLKSGEDVEWISRASAAGFCGAYDPGPCVWHHHRRKVGPEVDELKCAYEIGGGAYLMKCVLDPRRRHTAARHWYWSLRARAPATIRSRHEALSVWNEMVGALGYLLFRIREIHMNRWFGRP